MLHDNLISLFELYNKKTRSSFRAISLLAPELERL